MNKLTTTQVWELARKVGDVADEYLDTILRQREALGTLEGEAQVAAAIELQVRAERHATMRRAEMWLDDMSTYVYGDDARIRIPSWLGAMLFDAYIELPK